MKVTAVAVKICVIHRRTVKLVVVEMMSERYSATYETFEIMSTTTTKSLPGEGDSSSGWEPVLCTTAISGKWYLCQHSATV